MTTTLQHHSPSCPPSARAFSLVEVMLSLAIASLGFITMLGLLPQGLELSRNAAKLSAESRIKQKLAGELHTTSWDRLTWTTYGPTRYFNDQGIELQKEDVIAEGVGGFTLAYVAAVKMPEEPLDFLLPAGGQGIQVQDHLRRVSVCIAATSDPDFSFASAPERLVRTHAVILADSDG